MRLGRGDRFFLPGQVEGDMQVENYIIEAAVALAAPPKVWRLRTSFNYDGRGQEWCFEGPRAPGGQALTDVHEWAQRICGWLQFNYPLGPDAASPPGGRGENPGMPRKNDF